MSTMRVEPANAKEQLKAVLSLLSHGDQEHRDPTSAQGVPSCLAVLEAIPRLGLVQQRCVELYLAGCDHKEMAQRLGLTERSCIALWARALDCLVGLLDGGSSPPPAASAAGNSGRLARSSKRLPSVQRSRPRCRSCGAFPGFSFAKLGPSGKCPRCDELDHRQSKQLARSEP